MTKSENLARNKRIIDVVSGAVYRESGECINVVSEDDPNPWPLWDFAMCDYELFTPEFSWELFKEGVIVVQCTKLIELEQFKIGLAIHGMPQDRNLYLENEIYSYYLDGKVHWSGWSGCKRGMVTIQFSSIPPELLEPAFEPRKPETFTKYEWGLLTPEERTACNELIRGEIEYNENDEAINLEWYNPEAGYFPTTGFTSINSHQYRTKPKPEYEPYDKPESWMINKVLQSKTNPDKCYSIIGMDKDKIEIIIHSYYHGITMPTAFDKYNLLLNPDTGETSPFRKLKGGE